MNAVYQFAIFACLVVCTFVLPWWLAAVCFFAYALFFHSIPVLVLAAGVDAVFGITAHPYYTVVALGAVVMAFLATRYVRLNIDW